MSAVFSLRCRKRNIFKPRSWAIGSRFKNAIAITIAIKNQSKKIANRFSFHDRIAVVIVKSIGDFHLQIGQRLKNRFFP